MIALATCSGAMLLANGQKFGRSQRFPEPGGHNAKHPHVSPRPLDDLAQLHVPTGQSWPIFTIVGMSAGVPLHDGSSSTGATPAQVTMVPE